MANSVALTDEPQFDLPEVTLLLRAMGEVVTQRNDPRRWRLTLLGEINRILGASVSAAFIVRDLAVGIPPLVVSIFDTGFKGETTRQAFLREFNTTPFSDPLSRECLNRFIRSDLRPFTVLRREVIGDERWYAAPEVRQFRREAQIDDCLFSIQPGPDGTQAFVLCAFRPWGASTPFGGREQALLEAMHGGLEPLYRSEEANGRLSRATELSPRVRETLDHLLSGLTERQVARRMALSVHTVHDYVKMLYSHFGVSSRSELLARWLRIGGTLPERRPEAGAGSEADR